ncbi:MAG: metallophosphoesterase [Lachnospiraceae bacterium]|nr:metallophosphoesterase [Lachnospiraceae bacterium]
MKNKEMLCKRSINRILIISYAVLTLTIQGCTYSKAPAAEAVQKDSTAPGLHIEEATADIKGMKGRFNIFFLADSHISKCDDRDKDLITKAARRSILFKKDGINSWDRFDMLIEESKNCDTDIVVMGGDIVDSAMYASIDHVRDRLSTLNVPYMYYMGNHDFEYGAEYFTPLSYSEYLPRLDDMHGKSSYQVREYDDFIIFAADDNNSQVNREILDAFKKEITKGKPVILALHVPIEPVTGDRALIEKCNEVYGENSAKEHQLIMGPDGCVPNSITQEFIDLVLSDDSPVIMVLAGHLHFYHKDMLNEKTVQIITGPAYAGEALKITVK